MMILIKTIDILQSNEVDELQCDATDESQYAESTYSQSGHRATPLVHGIVQRHVSVMRYLLT